MDAEAADLDAHRAEPAAASLPLRLQWRPYRFVLPRALVTSQGAMRLRRGWLLRLEAADGRLGWGEAAMPAALAPANRAGQAAGAPAEPEHRPRDGSNASTARRQASGAAGLTDRQAAGSAPAGSREAAGDAELRAALEDLPATLAREALEARLPALPAPLACALGMALAELDGLGSAQRGGWLAAPPSALLLPAGEAAVAALEQALAQRSGAPGAVGGTDGSGRARSAAANRTTRPAPQPRAAARLDQSTGPLLNPATPFDQQPGGGDLTIKWKVASGDDALERHVLERLLKRLPSGALLRLDANGGWDRDTAWRWAERLAGEPHLEWLEQPLPPDDREGLALLARRLPVALDESLRLDPELLADGWRGWQVRRPLAEADPRPLLAALLAGTPRLMLSTALETGIGRRFLEHLAGLQALGPTPTAPGLAPGWRPRGALFALEPETVWRAAR